MSSDLAIRPSHEPTDELRRQVRTMAACGLSPDQCSQILGINLQEFEQFYQHIWETGTIEAVTAVGAAVISAATDRKHPQFFQCASFVLRARGGWRDIRAVENVQKELPEEQKQKIIEQLVQRLTVAEKAKVKV